MSATLFAGGALVFGFFSPGVESILSSVEMPQVQVVAPATGGAIAKSGEKDASDPGRKAVQEYLAKRNASAARVSRIADARLARCFAGQQFFGVLFPRFPVARQLPEQFAASNVLAVNAEGKIRVCSAMNSLEEFFKTQLPAVKDDKTASDAAGAWLRLSQELVQDGFYQFEILEDSIQVKPGEDGKKAEGRAVVMAGGNGNIRVTLAFDKNGQIIRVSEKVDVRPGPRPICQATKLLDPDPIVRRMAEQDLLIMGRAAEEYLAEARGKADMKLREAIDQIWGRILTQK